MNCTNCGHTREQHSNGNACTVCDCQWFMAPPYFPDQQRHMAPYVYWTAIALVFWSIAGAGACNFVLWLAGRETISAYLRLNPLYFILPVGATVLFLGVLSLHLIYNG